MKKKLLILSLTFIISIMCILVCTIVFTGCEEKLVPTEGLAYADKGDYYEVERIGTATDPNIVIPSEYNGKPVTSIGMYAFAGCSFLESITIPDSVTRISDFAFESCSSLTRIFIPNNVTSIGLDVFLGCNKLTNIIVGEKNKNYSSINGVVYNKTATTIINVPNGIQGSFVIPDSVTNIEDFAFAGCISLTNIIIPNSVVNINRAFVDCSSLTSINIPDSVKKIGDGAFAGCTSLTNITIPNSVTCLGAWMFFKCTSLTSITFPNNLTSIEYYMFHSCTSLTDVTIPESVTSIDENVFYQCTSLKNIRFKGTMKQWESISKDYSWDNGIGAYTVYCTDGNITW